MARAHGSVPFSPTSKVSVAAPPRLEARARRLRAAPQFLAMGVSRLALAGLPALACLAFGAPARAADSPRNFGDPHTVHWHENWRRVAPWETVATLAVYAGAFGLRFAGPEPPDNWRGGVLFDDALGERVRLDNPVLSGDVGTMTDVLYFSSMVYRLIDSAFIPWLGYDDGDLAQQMSMIDLESFALVAGVMFGSQVFVGRQRPEYNSVCDGSGSAQQQARCQQRGSRFRSFIAGHPATVLTAAGLTCTHHGRLPLYGGGWGDTLACGLTLGAAAFTGAGRVLAGKHYPTDLAMGFTLGAVAGFVLPRALHYGFSSAGYYDAGELARRGDAQRQPSRLIVQLLPWSDRSGYGVSTIGMF